MFDPASVKNSALGRAITTKPYNAYTTRKASPEDVAAASSALGDNAVQVDDVDSEKQLKQYLLLASAGIAVGVFLLFILAKKYGYIKF